MEIIFSIHAINTAFIQRVTESTAVVCIVVQKGSDVNKVHCLLFCIPKTEKTKTIIMVTASYIYKMLSLLKSILKYFLLSIF